MPHRGARVDPSGPLRRDTTCIRPRSIRLPGCPPRRAASGPRLGSPPVWSREAACSRPIPASPLLAACRCSAAPRRRRQAARRRSLPAPLAAGEYLVARPSQARQYWNMDEVETKTATVHGRSVTYAEAGSGPALLLIHGMAGSCENWQAVIEPLAPRPHRHRPRPSRPRRVGSRAAATTRSASSPAGLRDLLLTLGHERATLVGHSLGGGIAMQFAYQFPEMVERLVLVSSGGLGPEVSPILRAAALPGADLFIARHRRPRPARRLGARARPEGRWPEAERRRRRGRTRLLVASRPRAPQGLPRHPALGRRHRGPARRRRRPPLPRRQPADPDRLGLARPDHPRRAWRIRPRGTPRQPARDLRWGRPPASGRGAGAFRRRARAIPRRDRAGTVRPRRVARPVEERLDHGAGIERRARQDSNL